MARRRLELQPRPLPPMQRDSAATPGTSAEARNGATGLALLPFLGAGQTHKKGKYKSQVKAGLYFLVNQMKVNANGGSLYESGGSMYSHGIGSIVLCEAYAMTHDKSLYAPAQQALNFIAYAQDPVGGGWRYSPRQAGDTSAVGWQIMAMKSGHMGYLRIPPVTVQKAFRFLDSVQANNGAHYGYTDPAANRDATTAVGLLCRMYLGWKKDNPALERGRQVDQPARPFHVQHVLQLLRHPGDAHTGKATCGRSGTRRCATSWSRRKPRRATRRGAGTWAAATPPTGADASTARPWPRWSWKSTTATCPSTASRAPRKTSRSTELAPSDHPPRAFAWHHQKTYVFSPSKFRDIVSGRRRGLRATSMRLGLRVVEVPYTMAVGWRNRRYDSGKAPVASSLGPGRQRGQPHAWAAPAKRPWSAGSPSGSAAAAFA